MSVPVAKPGSQCAGSGDIYSHLLLAWQEHEDHAALARLLKSARPLIESVANQVLQAVDIASPVCVDDTLSLVIDHIRRLPRNQSGGQGCRDSNGERPVAPFAPRPGDTTPGERFLVWLTRRRAADCGRRLRRARRRAGSFSSCDPNQLQQAVAKAAQGKFAAERSRRRQQRQLEQLRGMLELLAPHDRLLMEAVMEGKTLAVIAHMLDCSEGTVCRRRQRIEQWLRECTPPGTRARDRQANTTVRRP